MAYDNERTLHQKPQKKTKKTSLPQPLLISLFFVLNFIFSSLGGAPLLCSSMAKETEEKQNQEEQKEQRNYYPSQLLKLDPFFSHHVIVAEKSTHKLYLYEKKGEFPSLLKTYQMATGKKSGDKFYQGDHRTPEGIYYFTQFLTHKDLISRHGKEGKIYGVGAFVLNYPNPIDQKSQKTGGGIWLHSTNDETRIEKGLDSRGCIVISNSDLIHISHYIELEKTPIIVVHEINYLNRSSWKAKRERALSTIATWLKAWKDENLATYISTYHKDFYDPQKGPLPQFKFYKKQVFSSPGAPDIALSDLSLLYSGEYIRATFKQNYKSSTIEDLGRKTLYLKQDEFYNWKIISERWSKHGLEAPLQKEDSPLHMAFRPSNRFFETNNPVQILGDYLITNKIDESGHAESP